jgi:hypothetical protein
MIHLDKSVKAFRRRRSRGIHRRSIDVTDAQLDVLDVRRYLDPDLRAMFTADGTMAERWALGCAQGWREAAPKAMASAQEFPCPRLAA